MNYPKWVDSAVEIKNFEKYHNFDTEIETSNLSYGVLVKPIELPKGKQVTKLTSADLCIKNGLVLPAEQDEINFYVLNDGKGKVHSLSCNPVPNVPGLYFVDEIIADKKNIFNSHENHSYFASIDGRELASYMKIPNEEIKVLQQSYINETGSVLAIKNLDEKLKLESISANEKVRILDDKVSLIRYRDKDAVFALGVKLPDVDKYEAVAIATIPVKDIKEVRKIKNALMDMVEKSPAIQDYLKNMQQANQILRGNLEILSERFSLDLVRNRASALFLNNQLEKVSLKIVGQDRINKNCEKYSVERD